MESKFTNPEGEEQQWRSSRPPNQEFDEVELNRVGKRNAGNLCARVQDLLPSLIEGDGEVRPELATAVYGHLSVCPDCSKEFDAQQRVVSLLEQTPMLDLPKDFTAEIMQRVTAELGIYKDGSLLHRQASHAETASILSSVQEKAVIQTRESVLFSNLTQMQRIVYVGVLAAISMFVLASQWGKMTLGGNVDAILNWLGSAGEMSRSLPIIGQTTEAAMNALAQSAQIIRSSYMTLGATAVPGLIIDVAIGGAMLAMNAKRNRQGGGFIH